jgi:hypothetical protein
VVKMIVNKLDKSLSHIFLDQDGSEQDLQRFKDILEDLCEELKQLWHGKGSADSLVEELIDYCLYLVTRPLKQHEWDDIKVDHLKTLFSMAESIKEFRDSVSWAAYSKNPEIRILFNKQESEKQMFFLNDTLENLEGMAYRLLTWLNTRNSLIQAFRNR